MIDLKRFRKENKLDQLQLAEIIGVAQSRISKYETGKELSKSVEERILDKFPEAKAYIIGDRLDENKLLIAQKDEEIKYLKELTMSLLEQQKELTALIENMNNKMKNWGDTS